jgi:hypothetical protein
MPFNVHLNWVKQMMIQFEKENENLVVAMKCASCILNCDHHGNFKNADEEQEEFSRFLVKLQWQ